MWKRMIVVSASILGLSATAPAAVVATDGPSFRELNRAVANLSLNKSEIMQVAGGCRSPYGYGSYGRGGYARPGYGGYGYPGGVYSSGYRGSGYGPPRGGYAYPGGRHHRQRVGYGSYGPTCGGYGAGYRGGGFGLTIGF